jgi:hypothetical protein
MKNAVFWDIKNQVRTSQETYYTSATEPGRLMPRKIWGFHGGDYEESRLLGYKNPVRTAHETHYLSVTDPNRLILCIIWDIQGGDYEEYRFLGCWAVWLNTVRTSLILVTLMIEVTFSSKRRLIQESHAVKSQKPAFLF